MNIQIRLGVLLALLIQVHQVKSDDFLTNMSDAGIEIRKTFKGSAKDQASPASFNMSGASGSDNYYNIDLAVKVSEYVFDFNRTSLWKGRLYPSVEFHRNTNEQSEADNMQGAISFEFERGLGACAKLKNPFCKAMIIDTSFKVKRDSHNDKTTQSASVFGTFSGANKSNWPGRTIVFGDSAFKLIYLPFIGAEYHRNLPIEEKVDGEKVEIAGSIDEYFAVARLNVGLYPFAKSLDEKLKLVFDYSYRSTIGSNDLIDNSNTFTDVSLDYYLDEKNRIALGFSYSNGQSPSRNFLDEEKWGIGFKLKL
jgi:hypothetical protein